MLKSSISSQVLNMLHRLLLVASEPLQGILIEFGKDLTFIIPPVPVTYAPKLRLLYAFSLLLSLSHELGDIGSFLWCTISSGLRSASPCVSFKMWTILIVISVRLIWIARLSALSVFLLRLGAYISVFIAVLILAVVVSPKSTSLVRFEILYPLRVVLLFQQVHRPLKDWDIVARLHVVVALLEVYGIFAAHEVFVSGRLGQRGDALVVNSYWMPIKVTMLIYRWITSANAIFVELVHGFSPFGLQNIVNLLQLSLIFSEFGLVRFVSASELVEIETGAHLRQAQGQFSLVLQRMAGHSTCFTFFSSWSRCMSAIHALVIVFGCLWEWTASRIFDWDHVLVLWRLRGSPMFLILAIWLHIYESSFFVHSLQLRLDILNERGSAIR